MVRRQVIILTLALATITAACSNTSAPSSPESSTTASTVAASTTTQSATATTMTVTTTTTTPGVAEEAGSSTTLSLRLEDGSEIEATLIDRGDLRAALCAGFEASFRKMERDAQIDPGDFYLPLPNEEQRHRDCEDFPSFSEMNSIEQSFCLGWAVGIGFQTIAIAESADPLAAIDVLLDACMGSHFAMAFDGKPAYDYPIHEHALFVEGLVCYPSTSGFWATPLEVPYVTPCPTDLDLVAPERSALSNLLLRTIELARAGVVEGERDEAGFYEVYILAADLFGDLIETSVLGEDEAILGGDMFCAALAGNAEEGDTPHDGTLKAIKEVGFLLGIADSHATFLGAVAAGGLCDEAAYQYALELYEEVR